ncbi:hypothetical protein C1W78_28120 [Burkholderia pseudomallei]|nr:type VI secretion system baseplate subunit TssF [Burkholderia pseudomallei]MBF3786013.1 type VI secretion system baseplate subunit TssF [Burkholderia pseudomallei]MBF3906774.1 type VI secretion system baseplate subunit TssF [Burkholderia pseudomallei]NAY09936.1 hypothetical protein [Burkholderia pseudomallei]NAY41758.1 hypothetical protein [Burkholderia pseudomallei]
MPPHRSFPRRSSVAIFWLCEPDDWTSQQLSGRDAAISLRDIQERPVAPKATKLAVELACTNGDLAGQLTFGAMEGDLHSETLNLEGSRIDARESLCQPQATAGRSRATAARRRPFREQRHPHRFELDRAAIVARSNRQAGAARGHAIHLRHRETALRSREAAAARRSRSNAYPRAVPSDHAVDRRNRICRPCHPHFREDDGTVLSAVCRSPGWNRVGHQFAARRRNLSRRAGLGTAGTGVCLKAARLFNRSRESQCRCSRSTVISDNLLSIS